ncbi:MAG: TetR/AcrR family transcriptional regulator [Chloroflexi bacterium]|nr:TetR/AcrR family transcriptional regulator [Chloroflexota bacterium]
MAKNTQVELASARGRILDAALEVIARRGYSAAGVQEIVDVSGTSKGSFYFHFPSKERMVMALLEGMSDRLINKVNDSVKHQPTPLHRVAGSIDALLAIFARKRNLARVLWLNIVGHGKTMDIKFLPIRERFTSYIQQELDAAVGLEQIKPVDTLLASWIWVGALHEVILRWLLTGKPSPLTSAGPSLRRALLQSVGADSAMFESSDHRGKT